jgi:hypothetical protein
MMKKSSYNEVMDALRTRQIGSRTDPVARLPNEVFIAIILDISSSKKEWYTVKDIDVLVPFMMVSKRWHNFITSEPLLWNFIVLDGNGHHGRVSRQLRLSAKLPLTLKFELRLDGWSHISQEVCKHRERIQTMVFTGSGSWDSEMKFIKIAQDLKPLPNLRRLGEANRSNFNVFRCDIKRIFKLFPSIKELHNISLSSQDLEFVKDKLVFGEVPTYDSPSDFLPIAEKIPMLRKVVFMKVTDGQNIGDDDAEQFRSSSQQLGWTHLTCSRYKSYPPTSFLLCFPHLTSLTIHMNSSTLGNMIPIIHRFPSLSFFEAHVVLDLDDILSTSPTSLPNSKVRTIKIFILVPYGFSSLDDNGEREHLVRKCREIPEWILRAMPETNYLDILIRCGGLSVPLFSLKEFFIGNEIIISFEDYTSVPSTDMQLPWSVDTLSIDCNWSDICSLSSPSLKHLSILDDVYEDGDDSDSENRLSPVVALEEQIDLRAWPSLETISLYKNWVQWGQYSLASLTSVTIWRSIQEVDRDKVVDNVTCFVREIACRPESYPSLEDIHLGTYPEWDIFFIMLERRNLLSSPSIKRIKKLSLPSALPHKIYQIIGDLIRCKWSDRPSNRELSVSGNARTILDENM